MRLCSANPTPERIGYNAHPVELCQAVNLLGMLIGLRLLVGGNVNGDSSIVDLLVGYVGTRSLDNSNGLHSTLAVELTWPV